MTSSASRNELVTELSETLERMTDTGYGAMYGDLLQRCLIELSAPSESGTTPKLLKDLRYELSRLLAGAPVDNARVIRLLERINEEPSVKMPEVANG